MFKLNWKYSYFVMVVFSTMMCAPNQLQAQQAPRFTQYMFNRALFNPAASGAEHDILAATFGFRQQWLKFDNGQAPQTLSFNSHASFGRGRRNVSKHDPLGAGMTVIRETLGIEERTHVNLALAYHIIQRSEVLRKNGDPELSFGMSAGLIQYQLGSAFDPKHPNDPLLIESNQNANAFDMGAGFLFENKKWEVNLSVQHLTQSTLQYNSQLSGNQSRHYFLSTAYKINGKQDSKLVLIPSFLFKYVPDAISQLDLNLRLASANNEAFWVGGSYRHLDALSVLAGINIADWGKNEKDRDQKKIIAFAYDIPFSKISTLAGPTYEIVLMFDVDVGFGHAISR